LQIRIRQVSSYCLTWKRYESSFRFHSTRHPQNGLMRSHEWKNTPYVFDHGPS
jgi:hypothetical protein